MRHKGHISPSLLLLIFLTYTLTDARQCSLHCSGTTGNLLNFKPGKTYQYKLHGSSVTTLPGAKNDVSKLGLDATVEVSTTNGCEHVLLLTDVKTTGPDGKAYKLDSTLGAHPVKFALQNGKVVELCTDEHESLHALNVKRAALSLLQSTVLKESGFALQHETDVFGSCPTNFEFSKQGGAVLVKKSRDLTKCAHREDLNLPFSTSTYFVQSDVQTSPLLSGTYHSEQKLEEGCLKSANSEEVYHYNPMSAAESSATVKVNTKLTFVGESSKPALAVNANKGVSLVFQAEHPEEYKGGVETMVELLKGSCHTKTVDSETASKFTNLVRAMANAPKGDLLEVYQKVKSGHGFQEPEVAQKMYFDGLAEANSASSVEVMAELLKNKELSGSKANYFLVLLGSVKHATRASLLAVMELLNENAVPEVYLAAGTLGGRFCREHDCSKFPEVLTFQSKLGAPLLTKGCKPPNKLEEDLLLGSLKGLANMKYLTNPVVTKLADYAGDSTLKARVRVALLETMRSDANKPLFKKVAGEVFKNPLEDSEVRVKAYLALAECPCGKVAALVKSVLENEKSFQVGSYVVSHLRNLRASTNPEKASARHHLGQLYQTQKYPVDFRKYSQNYELSYAVNMLNLGASAESNVLYSQKSYVPRSVSLNLTSYMFGHSFNWLEVDVRSENLEKALERVFGPRGKLHKKKVNEVYDDVRESATSVLESAAEHYEKTLRPKRSVSRDQLNALANKVSLHHELDDEVDVDVALRMYGAERFWFRYHSGTDHVVADDAVDHFFGKMEDSLRNAKDLNFDYRKQFSFLDDETLYPTGMGLALKVKAFGTTAYRVKVDGKFDVPALLSDPKNTDVRLQVLPSAAVELRGDLVLDGVAVEAGVKVTLNLHTSTGSDVTFRVVDGHGVDVKFGLPVKKQDVLSVKTDVSSVVKHLNHPEKAVPVLFDVKRETYSGCFDQLNEVLGVTVCGEVDVPWEGHRSLTPAYGPSKLSLHVDKDDDSLTYYHFKAYADDRDGVNKLQVLFDTPNSRVNRQMLLHLEGSLQEKKYVKLDLKSPWTNGLVEAALVTTPTELSFNAKVAYDDVEYSLKTGTVKTTHGKYVKYEPVLEYKAPEQARSALVGRRGGPKPTSQVVTVSGAVLVESNENGQTFKYENFALNTPRTKYSVDGTASVTKDGGDLDVVVHYDKEYVKLKGHYKEKNNKLFSQLSVMPSQYPDFNLNVKWDALDDRENSKYESKLSVVHGPDPNSATNKVYVLNKLEANRKTGVYATENTVTYPVLNLDAHVGLRVTPKSFKTDLRGKYDAYSAQLLLKGEVNTKKEGDYNGELRWELMGNSVGLTMSRKVLKNHQSKFFNVLDVKPGGRYELTVHATHKLNEDNVDLTAEVDLVLPADPKNVKLKGSFKQNEAETKGYLNALAGGKPYFQTDFNVKTGEKPSASYKLKLVDYVNSYGEFTYDGTNFKAETKLDLPKQHRQMDGKANFVVSKNKVSGSADFCWDTKNPEKTMKLETDTTFHDNVLDSQNTLTFGGRKTVFSVRGKSTGEEQKGSVALEVTLVLPNENKLGLYLSDSHDFTDPKNMHSENVLDFLNQEHGKDPNKFSLKLVGKNVDLDDLNFDGLLTMTFSTEDHKDLFTQLMLKKTPHGKNRYLVKGELAAKGSLLEDHPVTLVFDSDLPSELFDDDDDDDSKELDNLPPMNYHLSVTCGTHLQLESSGKVSENTLAADLNAKLPPGSPVTSLQWKTSNVVDVFDDNEKYKVKSNNELHWNGNKFVRLNGEAQGESNGFNYEAEWETNELPHRKLTGSAHWMEDATGRKADASAGLVWEGKTADVSLKMERNNENVGTVHLVGNTPEYGKFDFLLKNKMVKNGKGVHSDLVLATKGKKVSVSSKLELSELHPLFDVVVDHPDGKSRFLLKLDNKGERHWTAEVKAKWTGQMSGSFSVDSEVFLKSFENFFVKHTLDFPQQGIKKMQVELSNRPGRGEGKKVTFTVKKDDKLLVSGSSNYVLRQDGNEKVVEGNGQLKVKDETFPLNFKGSWVVTDQEQAAKLSVKGGKLSVNLVYKNTDDEFNLERTMCNDGKCSKTQLLHRLRTSGLDEYENTVVVAFDLHLLSRQLRDVYHVASYKRKGQTVDHLVETKYGDEVKFKYNGYLHDKEAGLLLTLPKRTVGAELKYDVHNKENNAGGSVTLEADLYLNKETNDKLCFTSNTYVERTKDSVKVSGETKLTHPALKKDLCVKGHYYSKGAESEGNLVLDLFKHENQKVTVDFKANGVKEGNRYTVHSEAFVKSEACKLDVRYEQQLDVVDGFSSYVEKYSYVDPQGHTKQVLLKSELSPNKYYFLFKLPSVTLLEMDVKTEAKGNEFLATGEYLVVSKKFHESLVYNKEKNYAKYHLKWDDKSLDGEFGVLMGKGALLKVGLNNRPAAEVEVALDETHFLKTNYNYDNEVLKNTWESLVEMYQSETELVVNALRAYDRETALDDDYFEKCFNECAPDFTNLVNHVKAEFKHFKEEAMADTDVSNALTHLKEGFGTLFEHLSVFFEELEKLCNTAEELVEEFTAKMTAVFKEVGPKLTEAFDRFVKSLVTVLEQNVKVCLHLVQQVLDELSKYKEDVDAFTKVLSDVVHEVGKQFAKVVLVVHEEVQKFVQVNLEQLKELPLTNMLKEKFEELEGMKLPEEVWMVYNEMVENVKQFLPTTECEDFLSALSAYLTKVLKQDAVETEVSEQELYDKLVQALRSLVTKLNEVTPEQGTFKPEKYVSLPLVNWLRLPAGSVSFSVVNLVRSKDFALLLGSLETFAFSLDPFDNVPPFTGFAHLLDGTEVLTFDGRHYHMKGSCSYVLSEDYVDRNFSVVGHFREGKLEAVTVWDHHHSLTLRKDAAPLKDGLEAEYPVKAGLLKAWATPYTYGARSKAGVVLNCHTKFDSCTMQVSGFYFNRLRGLFGNLNYERYDDLVLPEGNVGNDAAQFCNSWKVDNACPDVPAVPQTNQRQRVCTEMFASDDSDLVLGRPWLPLGPYRDACDNLVATTTGNKKKAACKVAMNYVYVAQKRGAYLLEVPSECVVCEVNNKKLDDDDSTVVTPGGAADVVFLVDVLKRTESTYKNFVQPLVPKLKAELQKHGVNDVRVVLMSYNSPTNKWTNYHSVNGKLQFSGHDCVVQFEEWPQPRNETWVDRLLEFKHKLNHELGNTQQMEAYEEVLDVFDFRPHALKSVVGVHGKPCETGSYLNLLVPLRYLLQSYLAMEQGVVWNLVTPVNGLATDLTHGVTTNDLVGFTDEEMYTVDKGDVKGDADYDTDYCVTAALMTGGVVVPSYNFRDFNREGKGAVFVQKAAELLANSLLKSKKPLECECGLHHGILPKPECELEE